MAPKVKATGIGKMHNGNWFAEYPEALREQLMDIPDGTYITATFTLPRKQKTLPQLGYYYSMVLPMIYMEARAKGWTKTIAAGTENEHDSPVTSNDMDTFLKEIYARAYNRTFTDKGNMSREEASDFIDNCINFGNGKFGCHIPPADPNWRNKENKNG